MELCMAAQEDPTPWETATTSHDDEEMLDGRAHFSLLGVVRRKPARVDAEATRSKSCSDKLALRQVSSLLSYETSLLVAPTRNAYLYALILPEEEFSRQGCERSFVGRMRMLDGRIWSDDDGQQVYYAFRPFNIFSIPSTDQMHYHPCGKPKKGENNNTKSKPGNVSAIWAAASSSSPHDKSLPFLAGTKTGLYENVVNGVKQGHRASTPTAKGASCLSRAKMWALVRDMVQPSVELSSYKEFKAALYVRDKAITDTKAVLKGWLPNVGDESWRLDVLIDPKRS